MKKDAGLLERRVHGGLTAEKETSQKIIQSLTAVAFIAMLVVPGTRSSLCVVEGAAIRGGGRGCPGGARVHPHLLCIQGNTFTSRHRCLRQADRHIDRAIRARSVCGWLLDV